MDIIIAFSLVVIFIYLMVGAGTRKLNAGDLILFVILISGSLASYNNWDPQLNKLFCKPPDIKVPDMPDEPEEFTNYVSEDYEPEDYFNDLVNPDTHYDDVTAPVDFDRYGNKGYIPGYSDVSLYSKDGRKPYDSFEKTREGSLRYDDKLTGHLSEFDGKPALKNMMKQFDGSRSDNKAAALHHSQQRRGKENMTRSVKSNRRAYEKYIQDNLVEGEATEWWSDIDMAFHPIKRLQ